MSLLGTDIISAYTDGNQYQNDQHLNTEQFQNNPTKNTNHQHDNQSQSTSVRNNSSSPQYEYNQQNIMDDIHTENAMQQIDYLKNELNKQKQLQYKMNVEQSTFMDKFLDKKKDVIKLFNLSLTILLGMSMHYVIVDWLKDYIRLNTFSDNKEFFIKLAYPVTILMFIWVSKVINK